MIKFFRSLLYLSVLLAGFHLQGNELLKDPEKFEKITLQENEKLFNELKKIHAQLTYNPAKAVDKINPILQECIKKGYSKETAYAYILMGKCYKVLQESSIALEYLNLAKKEFDRNNYEPFVYKITNTNYKIFTDFYIIKSIVHLNDHQIPAMYYSELAEIYTQLGDYENSNLNYEILIEKFNHNNYNRPFYYALAQNYLNAKNYKQALKYYKKILTIEKNMNSNLAIQSCYKKIASCYYVLGDIENSNRYYSLSKIDIGQTVVDSLFQILNKGIDSIDSKGISGTKPYNDQNREYRYLSQSNTANLGYLKLAKKYFNSEDYSKASRALDKYFKDISYALFDEKQIEIIKDIARVLSKNGQEEKALSYMLKYEELRDTILSHQVQNDYKSTRLGSEGLEKLLNIEKLQRDKEFDDFKITQLEKENNLRENLILELVIGLILGLLGIFYLYKISKQRKYANQKLELRSLRSQMNPHFIFNALNSVNSFISLKDERKANSFLSRFSGLMRTVMENAEYDFISLTKELEILESYLEMEHFRFKDKFEYHIEIDESLDEDFAKLPPMLIQPYLENAIWHGLRYKTDKGLLKLSIQNDNGDLLIQVSDNGVGRAKSKLYKTKNQLKRRSIALDNIDQRIRIFKDLHKIKISVQMSDLYPDKKETGTLVRIRIPQPE